MADVKGKTRSAGPKSSERKLSKTAEGRERRLAAKTPDLDEVDEAVTAAIKQLLAAGAIAQSGDLVAISRAAVEHLVWRGYDRKQAKVRLLARLKDPRRYRYRDVPCRVSLVEEGSLPPITTMS